MKCDAIVIGVSAGGLKALSEILPCLKRDLPVAVIVVQHLSPDSDDFLANHLDNLCEMRVCEASDKELLETGTVYIAPANYHLLVEQDRTLALSVEERVNYSRPSVDVLFMSAAEVYLNRLIGVVLTGANSDGAMGLRHIKDLGGVTVVQSPETSEVDVMPLAAIEEVVVDHLVPLSDIGALLNKLAKR